MNSKTLTSILSAGALAASLLSGSSAHADPIGTKSKFLLGSFPSSGSNAGKYAAAWVDAATNNCMNVALDNDSCFEARGNVTGKVLNAQVEALAGKAFARHRTPGTQDFWELGYMVKMFGLMLISRTTPPLNTVDALMNVAQEMPLDTNEAPFTTKGQVNLALDFSVISSYLSILPDATLTVNYSLHGGVTMELKDFPKSGFGSLALLRVLPWGSMTANGSVHGDGSWYTFGPVRAKLYTAGDVQVIAPNSNIDLNGTFAFATNKADLTESHYLRLLKGKAAYAVDGWLNPGGQIIDTTTFAVCGFGLFCSGTSYSWVPLASGLVWDQSSSYMKYFTDDATNTIFSGTLQPQPPM